MPYTSNRNYGAGRIYSVPHYNVNSRNAGKPGGLQNSGTSNTSQSTDNSTNISAATSGKDTTPSTQRTTPQGTEIKAAHDNSHMTPGTGPATSPQAPAATPGTGSATTPQSSGTMPNTGTTGTPQAPDMIAPPSSRPGIHIPGTPPTGTTAPNGMQGTMPGTTPRTTPGTMPGSVPNGMPGTMPGTTPRTAPGTMPGSTPNGMPGTMPGTTPRTAPGTMPGSVPNGMPRPETMPDNMPTAPNGVNSATNGMEIIPNEFGFHYFYNSLLPEHNPYKVPMGIPLIPLYGYDSCEELDKDASYMKQLYPSQAKIILPYIESECDQMEYDGSVMFDEYPDKVIIDKITDRIYEKVKDMDDEPQLEAKSLYFYPQRRSGSNLRDVITLLLLNEIFNRRRRYRSRRRWF